MAYTFKQLVKNLPPSIREELLEEIKKQGKEQRMNGDFYNIGDVVDRCFNWASSKRGDVYWSRVCHRLYEIWDNNIKNGNIQ